MCVLNLIIKVEKLNILYCPHIIEGKQKHSKEIFYDIFEITVNFFIYTIN